MQEWSGVFSSRGTDSQAGVCVRAEAQAQAEEIARRVAADPVHREMALLEAMEKGWL